MKVLVVGANGVVGSSICEHLKQAGIAHVAAGHINGMEKGLLKSDITMPLLGLDPSSLQDITHIVYSAGSTKFNLSLADVRKQNTEPMEHLIALADKLPHLEQLVFVSTVYASGLRAGTIVEQFPKSKPAFSNTYEQSKYEAEKILISKTTRYKVVIARLSTVVSNDLGVVAKYDSIHRSLQYLYLGLVGMLPGSPHVLVDMISSDFASQKILQILNSRSPELIYHIASGAHSMTIEEVLQTARTLFDADEPGWLNKGFPMPLFVSLDTFNSMGETLLEAGNIIIGGAYKALSTYAPQLTVERQFDTANADKLGSVDQVETRVLYERMVHYCLSTKWGHHADN